MAQTTESAPEAGGALSVSGAVAELAARRASSGAPETGAPEETTEIEAPETGADDATVTEPEKSEGEPTPEEGDSAPETANADAEAEQEAEQPPINAPAYWDVEARAAFKEAPPAVQAAILKQEQHRNKALSEAQREAAEARKQAEGQAEYRSKLDAVLDKAEQTFRGKWDGVDWIKWSQEKPDEAARAKLQYDLEMGELRKLQYAQKLEADKEFDAYVKAEEARLSEVAPELADPEKGKERRAEVANFLREQGIPDESLARISAVELALAHDAMRYRRAKSAMAEPLKPKTAPSPPVRPAGGRSGGAQPNAELKAAEKRLAETGRREDAMRVMALRRRAQG